MNDLWTVFVYELRRNLRRKAYLFTTFGVPLIGALLLVGYQVLSASGFSGFNIGPNNPALQGLPLGGSAEQVGYVDLSGLIGDVTGDLAATFTRYDGEEAARAALDVGDISAYYLIPADYMETGDVTLVMPRLNLGQVMAGGALERLLRHSLTRGVDAPDVVERLIDPSSIEEIRVQPDSPAASETNADSLFLVVYLFVIALLMSMFLTNGYLMQGLIEEKETRLIEILMSSLRPRELLTGKILALGLLGLLQMVVWIGSIVLIMRLSQAGALVGPALTMFAQFALPAGLLPLMLVYFVLAYLMFAAFYSIIGAIANSAREGPQYAGFLTLPAIVPLWFTQLFITTPDATAPVLLSLFPLTAPLAMIQRVAIGPVPLWQIGVSLALLALTDVALMALAGRVFRVHTLLAGQMPRLRDLPKLLRA